jgi:hypothetical protein
VRYDALGDLPKKLYLGFCQQASGGFLVKKQQLVSLAREGLSDRSDQ